MVKLCLKIMKRHLSHHSIQHIFDFSGANSLIEIEESTHSLFILIGGCVIGGLLFVALDQIIGQGGGYLRKTAYIISKSAVERKKFFREILADISKIPIFKSVPPQDIQAIIVRLKPRLFHEGEIVFKRALYVSSQRHSN